MKLQAALAYAALDAAITTVASGNKIGLCCMECTATSYIPFATAASWAYRYNLFIDDAEAASWMATSSVEFVAHLAHKKVPLPNGACTLDSSSTTPSVPLCTASMLDAALQSKNNQGVTMKYLMGFNEAYDHSGSKAKKKYIAPADAAKYWRMYFQGLAARNGNLTLVSPTTGVTKGKLEWFGDMLLACYDQRSKGCDVETIKAFSVHDYKCGESYWRSNYGVNGTFQQNLKSYLGAGSSSRAVHAHAQMDEIDEIVMDWDNYVNERKIWVTETNCNGDYGYPPPPTSQLPGRSEQCARITGQRADALCGNKKSYGNIDKRCGIGSIATLESLVTVARISWWNTHQTNKNNSTKTFDAMLVSATGELYPAGKAIANGLERTTDCS